ncbi:DUF6777 domain-containing protein [Streptomyces sp. NPDC005329]|uniref:DUF6777 domain-containing protein n=1 Tax=Streptomyces sp. NPDC005329 TaxID=3157034 RepID=UPI0033B36EC6
MSVEPPSSGRPTGPPSGPLSGPPSQPPPGPPSQPPSGPPSQPSDAGSPGGDDGPRRSRWKSAPRIALITTAVVAVTALALVLTLVNGGGSGSGGDSGQVGEIFMQPAAKTGPEPYTKPAATDSSLPPASVAPSGSSPPTDTAPGVDGGDDGLYGGTRNVSSCDVERQIKALQADPAKNRAFASVAGVAPSQVPAHLRSLTPVQLRLDTRVTNHGYRDGAATTYQAVLQAGTAVLVDRHGVPRVRCACGNPLTPPLAQRSGFKRTGESWPLYSPSTTVVVKPSVAVIDVFVLYDPEHDHHWFAREPGDKPHRDRPTRAPARLTPSITVSTPSPPTSDGARTSPPCVSPADRPPDCPLPPSSGSSTPSERPPSERPSSERPSSEPPSSEPPSSEPPSGEPPSSRSSRPETREVAPPSSETPSSEPPSSASRSPQQLVPDSPGSETKPSSPSEPTSEPESSSASSPRLPLTGDSTSQSPPTSAVSSGGSSPAPGSPADPPAV